MTRKKHQISIIVVILIFLSIICLLLILAKKASQPTKIGHIRRNAVPTILIPGSSAGPHRFDSLVKDLNHHDHRQHSLLRLTVHQDNTITHTGSISRRDNRPFVVISFTNNHDGYRNIRLQARWLRTALDYLKRRSDLHTFNVVGHSNGGLVFTDYLEHYYQQQRVDVSKFMFIGSPFNFNNTVQNQHTTMLETFIQHQNRLPHNLIVFGVLGAQSYSCDGRVPVQSVDASRQVFQNHVQLFNELLVTGKNAQHSDLVRKVDVEGVIHNMIMYTAS
ncbi:alpha/beta hydrolase [Furfurilactobacillus rossiae]|nr:alpha/beta hydrolase [Furfurilactobacillus rossiae]